MTWIAVARKDVKDAIRSYWLWGLTVLFVIVFTAPAVFLADQIGQQAQQEGVQVSSDAFLSLLSQVNAFFVPIIAIVMAYAAIAGERDSGTVKLLLSLPHSRLDVVAGKAAGRGFVVSVPILVGFVVAGLAFVVTPVEFGATNYVLFAGLTVLLGLAFVGLSVGFSAAADSARQAMISTVGVFVVFTLIWDRFANGLISLLSDYTDIGGETMAPLHLFVQILNPTRAYTSLTRSVILDDPYRARLNLVGGGGLQGQLNQQLYANAIGESLPAYLSDPVLVAVIVFWVVATPLAGYWVFENTDI